jgi:hypothetical protein
MNEMSAVARRAAERARLSPTGTRAAALAAHPPPPDLAHLTDRIGPAGVLALVERHGGTRIHIPKSIHARSRLALLIGETAARELSIWRGGEVIKIPQAHPWRIRLYRAEGLSYPSIALRLGCNESTVHKHLQEGRLTGRQLDLGL